ncbi:MAG: ABC transporter permease [Vulcanimicrobiaceae bacterium]
MSYLLTHPLRVLALTQAHVIIVGTSLALALAIAFPLGVLAARHPKSSGPIIGGLAAVYTIPSLALLAILVQAFGLGFWTAVIALVAYGQFVLVRNIAVGLRGVPQEQREAAVGLGMSPTQTLLRVELPHALPVILGGVRIAAIAMVALATLAAYVGAGGLGTLIFEGLAFRQIDRTIAGSLAVAALAIAIDIALRAVERRAA